MEMDERENRTVLITGVLYGLGPAYAEYFARRGYSLILTGKDKRGIRAFSEEMEKSFGVPVIGLAADLSERRGLALLSGQIDLSCPDVMINNAAEEESERFVKMNAALAKRVTSFQMNTVVSLTLTVLRRMINQNEGRIINISPDGFGRNHGGSSLFSSSGIFIRQFTEGLKAQLTDTNIRVQAVYPGMMESVFGVLGGLQPGMKRGRGIYLHSDPNEIVEEAMRQMEEGKVFFTYGVKRNAFWRRSEINAG